MRLLLVTILFCLALPMLAAEAPTTEQLKRVGEVLATFQPNLTGSPEAVEEALVALGPTYVPAMQRALQECRQALSATTPDTDADKYYRLTQEIDILDNATTRLTWKINPRALILAYVTKLRFEDGRTFVREGRPTPLDDVVLPHIFPNFVFYSLYYPPYRGGVAPTQEMLQNFEVPAPLRNMNVFAVDKSGKLQLITDTITQKQFFAANLPSIRTESSAIEATYAWLRMTRVFAPNFHFTLTTEMVKATPKNGAWTGTGTAKVIPTEYQNGEITVTLSFDERGHLTNVQETQNLTDLSPPPPTAMPHTPGGPGAKPLQPAVM